MSAPSTAGHRLYLQLPESWVVSNPREWEHRQEIARAIGLATNSTDPDAARSRPDLVATFFEPVTLSAEPVEIVIASLVVWSYASESLPTVAGEQHHGRVLRGIETSPGIPADFYVLTLPVLSRDGAVMTLLTFSTPNLPFTQPMDEAFRSIWSTAHVGVIDDPAHLPSMLHIDEA
jgi:hypothetical protein